MQEALQSRINIISIYRVKDELDRKNNRTKVVGFSIEEWKVKKLDEIAEKMNMTRTDLLRRMVDSLLTLMGEGETD